VETYTALWGIRGATRAWLLMLAATWLLSLLAVRPIGGAGAAVWTVIGSGLALGGAVLAVRFVRRPITRHARAFEKWTAAWTLALYLCLGIVPLFLR
jgi:hypothetical protein